MLYHLLKPVGVTGINLFFNSISVENQEGIPNQGPLIFAANHPNTMMDPLIVGPTATGVFLSWLEVHCSPISFLPGF